MCICEPSQVLFRAPGNIFLSPRRIIFEPSHTKRCACYTILNSDKFCCKISVYSMHIIVWIEEAFKVSLK